MSVDTFQYPKEWKDDEKMNVYFSEFRRARTLNPVAWDKKIEFWSEMIIQQCIFDKSTVFDTNNLPTQFERNGKHPQCIKTVVDNMVRLVVTQVHSSQLTFTQLH